MDAEIEEGAGRQALRRALAFHIGDQWIVDAARHIGGEQAADG